MSVFTPVTAADAAALLAHYSLGELERLEGIAQGVENTNYFLTTTTGEYVLTLFETIAHDDLPFYMGLMDHLAHHEVRCPAPMAREDGEFIGNVNGKPACIVSRLPGTPEMHPGPADCRAVGSILAAIHIAGVEYDAGLTNPHGHAWREHFAAKVAPRLTAAENALIESENRYQAMHDDTVLPQGIIHGDLFRDNILWDDEHGGGVIDFYFACDDALAFDLAITVNDWCSTPEATLDPERTRAMIEGYDRLRPLTEFERTLWPAMLRRAALRTWLGRLGYNHFPRDSHMTIPKDHAFSRRLLEHHVAHARELEASVA
ncbi:homoserine kinase [Usitatibacter palustris]|uniref:Homoserine kinase n=1 Tax=Usitatibacter palustris TaxID=2732487 RepID=A0A6M4H1Q7_9PROT|nr:homoserine kinase [Usitatibacter palustris]QJR13390.1 Homoserine kinase [Usitatibacter palustris]